MAPRRSKTSQPPLRNARRSRSDLVWRPRRERQAARSTSIDRGARWRGKASCGLAARPIVSVDRHRQRCRRRCYEPISLGMMTLASGCAAPRERLRPAASGRQPAVSGRGRQAGPWRVGTYASYDSCDAKIAERTSNGALRSRAAFSYSGRPGCPSWAGIPSHWRQ